MLQKIIDSFYIDLSKIILVDTEGRNLRIWFSTTGRDIVSIAIDSKEYEPFLTALENYLNG